MLVVLQIRDASVSSLINFHCQYLVVLLALINQTQYSQHEVIRNRKHWFNVLKSDINKIHRISIASDSLVAIGLRKHSIVKGWTAAVVSMHHCSIIVFVVVLHDGVSR